MPDEYNLATVPIVIVERLGGMFEIASPLAVLQWDYKRQAFRLMRQAAKLVGELHAKRAPIRLDAESYGKLRMTEPSDWDTMPPSPSPAGAAEPASGSPEAPA